MRSLRAPPDEHIPPSPQQESVETSGPQAGEERGSEKAKGLQSPIEDQQGLTRKERVPL